MTNFREILGFDEKVNKKILDGDFSSLQKYLVSLFESNLKVY